MRTYQPGPRDQAPAVTWRQWLLPLGAAAGIVALLTLSPSAPSGLRLSYSQFLNDVGAGSIRAVTTDPAGQVTGSLATGQPFTTTIPVALGDRTLAGRPDHGRRDRRLWRCQLAGRRALDRARRAPF